MTDAERIKGLQMLVAALRCRCPVCGEARAMNCRCRRSDSQCPKGHQWHWCTVHDRLVLGPSDHAKSGCSCEHPGCTPVVTEG